MVCDLLVDGFAGDGSSSLGVGLLESCLDVASGGHLAGGGGCHQTGQERRAALLHHHLDIVGIAINNYCLITSQT